MFFRIFAEIEMTRNGNWLFGRHFETVQLDVPYRVEAVGLKSSNYTLKIIIFVNMWNFGQFREKLVFCQ